MAGMGSPVLDQDHFRFYEPGTETGSTAIAAEDTNITRATATPFQVRILLQESGSVNVGLDTYKLYASHNGGTYFSVTASSSVIQVTDDSNIADDADTTNRLTGGSGIFITGKFDDVDGSTTSKVNITGADFSEFLWSVTIIDADVSNGDTIDFRVYTSADVVISGTYNLTGRATASKGTTTPKTVNIVASNTASLTYQVNKGISISSSNVVGITKAISRSFSIAASNTASVVKGIVLTSKDVVTSNVASLVTSFVTLVSIPIVSSNVVGLVKGISKNISIISSNSISVTRAISKAFSIATSNVVSFSKSIDKIFSIITSNTVTLTRAIDLTKAIIVTAVVGFSKTFVIIKNIAITTSNIVNLVTTFIPGAAAAVRKYAKGFIAKVSRMMK